MLGVTAKDRHPAIVRIVKGGCQCTDHIIPDSLALASGTRLGPWEILSAIRAGGIGEVYRARVYAADEWTEVGKLASALARDRPDKGVYLALDGAAAALIGDRALAMKRAAFLRNAFARGLGMTLALHRPTDFESLRGFTSFDDLMKPKG
jgi:hypothetical protein